MVETTGTRLDSVEQRLAAMEKNLIAFRQALFTLPSERRVGS